MTTPRKFTARGKTQTVTEWAAEVGLPAYIIFKRLNHGWDGEKVVSTPNRSIGGMSREHPVEYRVWKDMRRRCNNPQRKRSEDYHGRGISVCERWNHFPNFIADVGIRPSPKHSIERRDNDGNYCPENCYWATPFEQQRNKRTSAMLTHDGVTMCIASWAEKTGISPQLISLRVCRGWSVEKALMTPTGARAGPKCKTVITYEGRTMTLADWARETGIPFDTLSRRFKTGWSEEEALTMPVRPMRSGRSATNS